MRRFRGISFHKVHRKWFAFVHDPATQKQKVRGFFATDLEAAQVYNDMVMELTGDESKLNALPDDPPPPTEDEIQAACAAIRNAWTDDERVARQVGPIAPHP